MGGVRVRENGGPVYRCVTPFKHARCGLLQLTGMADVVCVVSLLCSVQKESSLQFEIDPTLSSLSLPQLSVYVRSVCFIQIQLLFLLYNL